MSNRLSGELSPYLLQHKDNPVDWFPWGEEALERARKEDKPIFLSIGYSACHWCHVMAHESFESEEIAAILNESYISIKVDREERPDLDQIYMQAVQMLTGQGGWPMSVFLTPQLEPFFGGTYFPPADRMGMPGFDRVLNSVVDAWRDRRAEMTDQAGQISAAIRKRDSETPQQGELTLELIRGAATALERSFDFTEGGFGGAPKFPHPMDLQLLLRFHKREPRDGLLNMVQHSLDKMAGGGIYDHLGGGFHRYSVDARWLVPHFEKMLYDNALLSATYLDAYLVTGEEGYARTVRETLDYVLREMHDGGGFYSTQDADSEGVEGKFFVWTPGEINEVLGEELGELFCRIYDVTESGNFEGSNILNLPKSIALHARILKKDEAELREQLAAAREKLLAVRETRIHPGLDDKVLVSWNALMIESLARAAGVLDEPRYLEAAQAAADFIWDSMRREDGRLLHTYRQGEARLDAYLDDYAGLIGALITLYEANFDERLIDRAVSLADVLLERFIDPQGGGFFFTADDHEQLITRQKDNVDNAVPSGGALAATALLRLGKLTGRDDFLQAAENTLLCAADSMRDMPMAMGQMLIALDRHQGPSYELVLLGDSADDALKDLRQRFVPNGVLACRTSQPGDNRSDALTGLFAGKEATGNELALYVCENFACRQPVVGTEEIRATWEQLQEKD